MKSLTNFILESSKKTKSSKKTIKEYNELAKDLLENGPSLSKIYFDDFDGFGSFLKNTDLVKECNTTGAQKMSLEKADKLIKAFLSRDPERIKEAYSDWKNGQSGAYWYQGYSRESPYGYVVEAGLIYSLEILVQFRGNNAKPLFEATYEKVGNWYLRNWYNERLMYANK